MLVLSNPEAGVYFEEDETKHKLLYHIIGSEYDNSTIEH